MHADPSAPRGDCQCGCGQPAPLASKTCRRRGWVRGEPLRYRHGHGGRDHLPAPYVEEDRGHDTPCWIWQRTASKKEGYGFVKVDGVTRGAHRVYYERHVGPIPEGLELDHLCRVRLCVNPAHLEPVTHAENVRRGVRDSPTWGRPVSDLALAILAAVKAGDRTQVQIARDLGVSRSHVNKVACGRSGPNARRHKSS